MISKIIQAHSFYHTCRYICQKPGAEVLHTEGVREHDYKLMAADFEMQQKVQEKVMEVWPKITSENLAQLTDVQGYCDEFYRLFGFNMPQVDYDADIDPIVKIPSLSNERQAAE